MRRYDTRSVGEEVADETAETTATTAAGTLERRAAGRRRWWRRRRWRRFKKGKNRRRNVLAKNRGRTSGKDGRQKPGNHFFFNQQNNETESRLGEDLVIIINFIRLVNVDMSNSIFKANDILTCSGHFECVSFIVFFFGWGGGVSLSFFFRRGTTP